MLSSKPDTSVILVTSVPEAKFMFPLDWLESSQQHLHGFDLCSASTSGLPQKLLHLEPPSSSHFGYREVRWSPADCFLECCSEISWLSEPRNSIASGDFTVEDDRAVVVQLGQRALESKILELRESGPLEAYRFYLAHQWKMLGQKRSEWGLEEFLEAFQFPSLEDAAQDQSPMNALMCAVFSSDSRMIRLLVSHGADVNSRAQGLAKAGYFDGQPLLVCAAKSHQPADVLAALLELRADVHARSSTGSTVAPMVRSPEQLRLVMAHRADLHCHFDPMGLTALGGACGMANADTIAALLKARCDPNPRLYGIGCSPLQQTILFSRGNRSALQIVRLLLENRADANALGNPTGWFKLACQAALAYEAIWGKASSTFLIRCYAILPRLSPLALAAFVGDPNMLQLLLDFGAEAPVPNSRGDFPEDLARENGHLHLLPILNTFYV